MPANFDFIQSEDQEFLRRLILRLHVCGEEYDANHVAVKAFTDLIIVLCKYYEIIMVDESQEATLLNKLMIDFASFDCEMRARDTRI